MVKSPDRAAKLAAALRENLKKRKRRQRSLDGGHGMQPMEELGETGENCRAATAQEEVSPADKPR